MTVFLKYDMTYFQSSVTKMREIQLFFIQNYIILKQMFKKLSVYML